MNWETFKLKHLKKLEHALTYEEFDKPITKHITEINKWNFAVTTSSCSGRIAFILKAKRKVLSEKYYSFHFEPSYNDFEQVWNDFNALKDTREKWIRVEPFILHIAFLNEDIAFSFFSEVIKIGIKRGGVRRLKNGFYHLEMRGNDFMAFPINACNNKALIYKNAISLMRNNKKRLEMLYDMIKEFPTKIKTP